MAFAGRFLNMGPSDDRLVFDVSAHIIADMESHRGE